MVYSLQPAQNNTLIYHAVHAPIMGAQEVRLCSHVLQATTMIFLEATSYTVVNLAPYNTSSADDPFNERGGVYVDASISVDPSSKNGNTSCYFYELRFSSGKPNSYYNCVVLGRILLGKSYNVSKTRICI